MNKKSRTLVSALLAAIVAAQSWGAEASAAAAAAAKEAARVEAKAAAEKAKAEREAKRQAEKAAAEKAKAEKKAAEAKADAEREAKRQAEKAAAEKAKAEKKAAEEKAKAEREAKRQAEKAAEEKARAEKKAAAEKAKAEKKAAKAKAKGADETPPAAPAPAKPSELLTAQGIEVTGDVAWFSTAHAADGRPFEQLFIDTLATTNIEAAAAIVQREARDSGYYLCSVTVGEGKKLAVEPGRFSQIDIRFENAGKDGKDGDVKKENGRWFTAEQIRRKLERAQVSPGLPFNYHLLYSQFRDINSNPDLGANIELRLPENEEDADSRALGVDVSVKESYPAHAIIGIDNYSTDSADNWTARATLQRLNLWKADHALTLNGFSALNGSLYGGAGSYYIPFEVGSRDAAFTIHGGYSEVSEDDVVKYIDVEGDGYFYGAQSSIELLDSTRHSLRLALGLTYRHTDDALVLYDTETRQKYKLNKNGVNLLPLSVALMYSSKDLDSLMGRNYATLEAVYNVGGSDEDEFKTMRQDAEKDYWLTRAQLARIQTVGGSFDADKGWSGRSMVFAKLDAQYAGGPLVPAEQMGVGGAASVRGYKEREFLGDHAAAFTLEYRTPLYLGLVTRPTGGKAAQDRLQFVVFSDVGGIWRDEVLPGEDDSQVLWGAGAGLRLAWSDYLQFRSDIGFPLKKTEESEPGSPALHLSVQAQF